MLPQQKTLRNGGFIMNEHNKISLRKALSMNLRAFQLLFKRCPHIFFSIVLQSIFQYGTPYINIYLSAQIINELAGRRNASVLWKLILITLACNVGFGLLNALLSHWGNYKQSSYWWLKEKLFADKLLDMDFCILEEQNTLDLLSKVKQSENWSGWGLGQIPEYFSSFLKAFISITGAITLTISLFTSRVPATAGTLTILNHPLFLLGMLVLLLFVTILSPMLANKASSYWAKQGEETLLGNRLFDFYGYQVYNAERSLDVRIYDQFKLFIHYMNDLNLFKSISQYARGPMGLFSAASTAVFIIFTGIIYVFVCLKAWAGAFGVGSITQYIRSITALFKGIATLITTLGAMKNNAYFLEPAFTFLDLPNTMYQGSLTTEKRSDRNYEVEFRDVSFRYPNSDTYALRHVSMKFNIGQRLAIVGMNGSGKTTFIKLLCRLYDPTEGQILLNGIDIRKYNYEDYRNIFSVVFQDFKLLPLPLGENIAASPAADKERVLDCLKKAGFSDTLATWKDGIDTYLYKDLKEDGVNVSGGEAQKIAIARTLYKDAPFIILDEPTAALDPVAEAEIYTKFNEIVEDKTAIYISHRLSSCRFCDNIAVFHEGNMIQQGNHDTLLADKNGKYHELWYAQAQYYQEA